MNPRLKFRQWDCLRIIIATCDGKETGCRLNSWIVNILLLTVVCQCSSWMIGNWRQRRWLELKERVKCVYILLVCFLDTLKSCCLDCLHRQFYTVDISQTTIKFRKRAFCLYGACVTEINGICCHFSTLSVIVLHFNISFLDFSP